jgi:ABC-type transport system involved in multi-copper enzyme maturation permease subunit
MTPTGNPQHVSFGMSVRRVFAFFFFLGRRTGKSRVFFLLGLIPVVLAIMVRILVAGRSEDVMTVFTDILMVFYLQFYVVILSLFYGTSVTAEEIESRTLPYLVTRPLSKAGIIIGKIAAYVVMMFVMVGVSLFFAFFIMNANRLRDPALYQTFVGYAGVLFLAIIAYTGFFAFLGTLLKRAILVGLVFGFGWETAIQYFPGSTQRFSIVHYLKSLLPYHYKGGGGGRLMSILLFQLEPTSPVLSVLILTVVAAVFIGLASMNRRTARI